MIDAIIVVAHTIRMSQAFCAMYSSFLRTALIVDSVYSLYKDISSSETLHIRICDVAI